MPTDAITVSPAINGDTVTLTVGLITRLKPGSNNTVVRAQADSSSHVQGLAGVVLSGSAAPTGTVTIGCVGRERVLLESGLSLAVGQTIYVSATTAGRGTNVAPVIAVPIGAVVDITSYARDSSVFIEVNIGGGSQGAQGAQGSQGAQGNTGAQGSQGAQGATPTQVRFNYSSALIDLTATADNISLGIPQLAGQMFFANHICVVAHDGSGTATGSLVWSVGNNASHNNIAAQTLSAANVNTIIAAAPSALNGTITVPTGTGPNLDAATQIVAKITTGVTGVTSLHGYLVIEGYWEPS